MTKTGEAPPAARRSLYLIGAMVQAEVQNIVRALCVDAEIQRLPEIQEAWRAAALKYSALVLTEPYSAPELAPLEGFHAILDDVASAPMFRNSFSQLPISFGWVDLDNLIAPQRSVNLALVEAIKERLRDTDERTLVEACLSPMAPADEPSALQQAANVAVFSAASSDFRFLGGFLKPVDESDLAVAHNGGAPAAAVVLLVGYGASSANVLQYRDRVVLNNGFHRAYALRSLGVRKMPVVVQHVENWELEFPAVVAGLPREYLLNHRRPVMLKDFFNEELVTPLDEKLRRKMVEIQWGVNQLDVPV